MNSTDHPILDPAVVDHGRKMAEAYLRRVGTEPHLRDKAQTILANARVLARSLGFGATARDIGGALAIVLFVLAEQEEPNP